MIVSQAEILVHLRKSTSISDSHLGLVTMLHTQAEATIKEELGYNVERDTYTEYYPMRDHGLYTAGVIRNGITLSLNHRPVINDSTLAANEDTNSFFNQTSSAHADADLTKGDDYFLALDHDSDSDGIIDSSRKGQLFRRATGITGLTAESGWTTAPGSTRVIYNAGWLQPNIPLDIRRAVLLTVSSWWQVTGGEAGLTSGRIVTAETIGQVRFEYMVSQEDKNLVLSIPPKAKALIRPWEKARI